MVDSVLAHLTFKLTEQRENAATEALAFVLNRSAAARAALVRHLGSLGFSLPPVSRVETQWVAGDESRPDVLVRGDEGRPLGFIEAKFWAAFTEAQPVEYLRRLAEAGGGLLVLLVPGRRLHLLNAEVQERCRRADMATTEWGPRGGTVGTSRVALTSWNDLLRALDDGLASAEDRDALSDLRQVRGLCERFESEGFLPLSREDLDNYDVPRLVKTFADITREIASAALAAGLLDFRKVKETHYWTAAGRYVRLPRAVAWLGVAYERWTEWGHPLWLQLGFKSPTLPHDPVPVRRAFEPWLASTPPRARADETAPEEGVFVPILLPTAVEREALVAAALDQLRAVNALLERSGVPLLGEVAQTE